MRNEMRMKKSSNLHRVDPHIVSFKEHADYTKKVNACKKLSDKCANLVADKCIKIPKKLSQNQKDKLIKGVSLYLSNYFITYFLYNVNINSSFLLAELKDVIEISLNTKVILNNHIIVILGGNPSIKKV